MQLYITGLSDLILETSDIAMVYVYVAWSI